MPSEFKACNPNEDNERDDRNNLKRVIKLAKILEHIASPKSIAQPSQIVTKYPW